ncbi:conserved protein of unknown function [Methylococcus capsulatus]|jgi:hypothetical protein|uniref:Uncharacterized protein n=2 Tax=Methylococcus capsulatus TaxID=414 RepID=A0AA35XZ82_METCP|nr:conserved protein of unknown function [Methylococcus capsulatus]
MAKRPSSRTSQDTGVESPPTPPTEATAPETSMESASGTEATKSTAITAVAVAVEGLKEGASQARKAAGEFVPALARTLSKVVYTGSYGITYGLVFGGLMIGSLIPKDSALAKGMCDGADSAVKDFTRRENERAALAASGEGMATT